ncbi:MAG: energy-coupling factor transporter transmembrane protein EcfT [Clostridia bacterium]|nr:energy-coupling factor transporter transmembrane protein EcfT [Clostridia bacterium]
MRVSLGRYVPQKSLFHLADPRTKIIWTIVMMVFVLLCRNWIEYLIAAVFVIGSFVLSRISFKFILQSLRPILVILVITSLFNFFFYHGTHVAFLIGTKPIYYESISMGIKTILRVTLLVISASLLTYTSTPVAITDGLESLMRPLTVIRVPVHEIALMMSIALRFIPTFADETDKIIKAQAARGAEFDSGNVFKKIKSYIPVLIPLFIAAFRSAEEMATAMEARCYRGGKGRTRFKVLKFSWADVVITVCTLAFGTSIILLHVYIRSDISLFRYFYR